MVHIKKSRHAIKQAKKAAREEKQEAEQTKYHHVTKKKKITKYSIISVIILILVFSVFFFLMQEDTTPGPHDAFAQCLTAEGAVMYGAYWCPHCSDQKKMFGKSFKYVEYVECDPKGKKADPEACNKAGIRSYPTWVIDGDQHTGAQPLSKLAQLSGCSLN